MSSYLRRPLVWTSLLYAGLLLLWLVNEGSAQPEREHFDTTRLAGYANAAMILATVVYALVAGLLAGGPRLRLASGNLLVLVSILLALEAGTRLLGLHFPALTRVAATERGLWVYDATKGWFHTPHASGVSYLGGPDGGAVRINALGLRGREVAPAKPPGVKRILVLGDSYVFGVGVDEGHLVTAELERLVKGDLSGGCEVINMGVSGYSTDQEYLLFREMGSRLSPDLVILVVVGNDFRANTADFVYDRYYKPFFAPEPGGRLSLRNVPVPQLSPWQRAKLWLSEESNLWNSLRVRTSDVAPIRRFLESFRVMTPHIGRVDEVEITAALIRALGSEIEAAGAKLLVVDAGQRGERSAPFNALGVKLASAGIPFLNLKRTLAEARRAHPSGRWDFPGNPHWNVDAHRVAAETIHQHLRKNGLGL